MRSMLKLGTAKVDITPEKPVPLAGFSSRKAMGPCVGVSHRLFARIFLFQQEDDKGKLHHALLVSADLIWWGPERVPQLKEMIANKWNMDSDAVVFHATHTHSGPQTSNRFTPLLGEYDSKYVKWLEIKLQEGIEEASRNLETVRMERGIGSCDIGIYRRQMSEMSPNAQGPTDPDVNVIRFLSEAGKPKAVLVHYTCHPVITRDNFVSSEFTGVAMELIEQSFDGDVIAAYLQGCCGDINPGLNGEFCFGQDPEVQLLGKKLADVVLGTLSCPMIVVPSSTLSAQKKTVSLPVQKLPSWEELETMKDMPEVAGEWSRLLLASPERISPELSFELTLLTIGQGLSFLAMNSEVVVEYGLFVKAHNANEILPIPYSNGMIGYTPTARQLAEGGYEAQGSTLYFGLPAPFDPAIETIIRTAMTSWAK